MQTLEDQYLGWVVDNPNVCERILSGGSNNVSSAGILMNALNDPVC